MATRLLILDTGALMGFNQLQSYTYQVWQGVQAFFDEAEAEP
jgi:hypothetical protein